MADTDSKTKPQLSYAFVHGLGGGPVHLRKLSQALGSEGFGHTEKTEQADIIIAHSAGCWLIPEAAKPKLVVYVGMPLSQDNPRQTFIAANAAMIKNESIARTLRHKATNLYYNARQSKRNFGIIRMSKTAQPVIFPKAASVFIANRHDPWPRADQAKLQRYVDNYDWAFISLPGAHDNILHHPEQYVAIIKHYAGLLG